jgi:hypothetical protein
MTIHTQPTHLGKAKRFPFALQSLVLGLGTISYIVVDTGFCTKDALHIHLMRQSCTTKVFFEGLATRLLVTCYRINDIISGLTPPSMLPPPALFNFYQFASESLEKKVLVQTIYSHDFLL